MKNLLKWMIGYTVWALTQTSLILTKSSEAYNFASDDDSMVYDTNDIDPTVSSDQPLTKANEKEFDRRLLINRTRPKPCDMEVTLYEMKYPSNDKKSAHPFGQQAHCKNGDEFSRPRPFVVEHISNSNMILLVVDTTCKPPGFIMPRTTEPFEYHYNGSESLPCFKVTNKELARRRPVSCICSHKNVSNL